MSLLIFHQFTKTPPKNFSSLLINREKGSKKDYICQYMQTVILCHSRIYFARKNCSHNFNLTTLNIRTRTKRKNADFARHSRFPIWDLRFFLVAAIESKVFLLSVKVCRFFLFKKVILLNFCKEFYRASSEKEKQQH